MPTIHSRIEGKRGCGYRKPGGLYFVSYGAGMGCGKLPFPLTVCPCCSSGVKFSRGFTWISTEFFMDTVCQINGYITGCNCIMSHPDRKIGLMWVGEQYYKTPEHFTKEGKRMGISKRISQLPQKFKVGETWIALAHRRAIATVPTPPDTEVVFTPGIFTLFRPEAIEYIVTGSETEQELLALEKRGFTLVSVTHDVAAPSML